MKVYFHTLGCRVNQYETDAVRVLFEQKGHTCVTDPAEADICVVNTCTVTREADRKSGQMLRKMARLNPGAVVVAMGCASEMKDGVLDADVVLGTRDKNLCVEKVEEFLAARAALAHKTPHVRPEVSKTDVYHDFGNVVSPEGCRAFMKIQDGCNKFCSYCIIPFARGRVVSRDEDNIIAEAKDLVQKGFREIIVSGIHVCSYGKDRGEDISALLRVLRKINDIEGIERIRLGSLEPMSMTPEFISGLAGISKLCPHFHLSLQSGSDTVLKRMNRDYTSAQYAEKVDLLREVFPTMSLTTDVICGFPGETDEEFAQTEAFVKKIGFTKIHVFPYSLREGTVAAKMEQVPGDISSARCRVLLDISSQAEKDFAASFTGRGSSVLVEKREGEYLYGYNPEYVSCRIRTDADIPAGSVVAVRVAGAFDRTAECFLA